MDFPVMSHWVPSTPPGARGLPYAVVRDSSTCPGSDKRDPWPRHDALHMQNLPHMTRTSASPPARGTSATAGLDDLALRQRMLEERERVVREKEAIVKELRNNAERMKREMETAARLLDERERALNERTELLQERETSLHERWVPQADATAAAEQAEQMHSLQRQVDHLEAALGAERGERDSITVLMQISSDFEAFKDAASCKQAEQAAQLRDASLESDSLRAELAQCEHSAAEQHAEYQRVCEVLSLVQARSVSLADHQHSLQGAMQQAVLELSHIVGVVQAQQQEISARGAQIQQLEGLLRVSEPSPPPPPLLLRPPF
eukprot:TRINITY_DN31277_c0_g1_i1.p1 TRINITY_DN31277_c0_g1~~TRINITY_DN31277_c0_g1_i1.p1  ORF type:complete len:339 (+),score=102.99 TRINITY_DN31277_c0_g1_i1:59-1018(+)